MLLVLSACTSTDGLPGGTEGVERALEATLAPAMPTVVHVSWTSPEPTVGRVRGEGVPDTPEEPAPTTDHDVRVVGLHAETAYTLDAFEGDVPVGSVEVTTGALDLAVHPLKEVTATDALPSAPYLLYSTVDFSDAGRLGRFSTGLVTIVDRTGAPVWGVAMGDVFPMFPVWVPGVGVRALTVDFNDYANSTVDTWDLDGNRTSTPLPGAHHEAVWHADGTLVACLTESRTVNDELVAGDILVEVAPDGTQRRVWDAFENLPVIPNWGWEATELADGAADWTHANGIQWLPDEDAYLVSLYGPQQVVRIDRSSGATEWILGEGGTFTLGADATFGPQHSPVRTETGLFLFDNGTQTSRLVELDLDEGAATADLAWSWTSEVQPAWNPVVGHLEPVAEEGMLVSWGLIPSVYLFDTTRTMVGEYRLEDPGFAGAIGAIRAVGALQGG